MQTVAEKELDIAVEVCRAVIFWIVGLARELRQVLVEKLIVGVRQVKALSARYGIGKHHGTQNTMQFFQGHAVALREVHWLVHKTIATVIVRLANLLCAAEVKSIFVVGGRL